MSGSTFGNQFKIMTWGESHGAGIGVVIDGCPAGLPLTEEDIQIYLDRRKPGQSKFATPRKEADAVSILSGVFDGMTTGTPISLMVHNETQRSADYAQISSCYRPGHADYTYDCKYGFRDYRGGGRASGRETIGRVAAGAVAMKILKRLGITVTAYTESIGPVKIDSAHFQYEEIKNNALAMPDSAAAQKAADYLGQCMAKKDSSGGVIACRVKGLPAGLGEPVFDKLDATLAKAIFSIGAVKGFEMGSGFLAASAKGSDNNDNFIIKDNTVQKETNHAGGVLGGISDGDMLLFRAAVKPTPSIFSEQRTVNRDGEEVSIQIKGRHDPVIVPRAVVVAEAMTALVLVDLLFANMCSKMQGIEDFYRR